MYNESKYAVAGKPETEMTIAFDLFWSTIYYAAQVWVGFVMLLDYSLTSSLKDIDRNIDG